MNEQTHQLIEKLAEKLGTTTEHLWGALVHQAPISSAIELILLSIYAAGMVWGYRLLLRGTGDDGILDEDIGGILWCVWGIGTLILFLLLCARLSYIVAGFFNPEYWALKEILD